MKHFTAREIAGFFKEWREQPGRKGLMPAEKHCEGIARAWREFSEYLKPEDEIQTNRNMKILEREDNKLLIEVFEASKELHQKLMNYRYYRENNFCNLGRNSVAPRGPGKSMLCLEKHLSKFVAPYKILEDFLATPSEWQNFEIILAEECALALRECGFNQRASSSSDNGPAAYVVGRMLEITPAAVGKRIRRHRHDQNRISITKKSDNHKSKVTRFIRRKGEVID